MQKAEITQRLGAISAAYTDLADNEARGDD